MNPSIQDLSVLFTILFSFGMGKIIARLTKVKTKPHLLTTCLTFFLIALSFLPIFTMWLWIAKPIYLDLSPEGNLILSLLTIFGMMGLLYVAYSLHQEARRAKLSHIFSPRQTRN